MNKTFRSSIITVSLFLVILLITGCLNEGSNKKRQDDQETTISLKEELREKIDTINQMQVELIRFLEKDTLSDKRLTSLDLENRELKESLIELRRENTSFESYIKQLSEEYQNVYFDICTEVDHSWCPTELRYFDPRELEIGDELFGMKVSSVSIGEFDPGSYIVSLNGNVPVLGNYEYLDDDVELGGHYRFETTSIDYQKITIKLAIGLDPNERAYLKKTLKGSTGTAEIIIENLTLIRLPHKPGYNSAKSIIKE